MSVALQTAFTTTRSFKGTKFSVRPNIPGVQKFSVSPLTVATKIYHFPRKNHDFKGKIHSHGHRDVKVALNGKWMNHTRPRSPLVHPKTAPKSRNFEFEPTESHPILTKIQIPCSGPTHAQNSSKLTYPRLFKDLDVGRPLAHRNPAALLWLTDSRPADASSCSQSPHVAAAAAPIFSPFRMREASLVDSKPRHRVHTTPPPPCFVNN